MLRANMLVAIGFCCTIFSALTTADEITDNKLGDHTGWYVGGSIGQIDSEAEKARNFNSEGAAYGVYGGYNFNHWIGIEMDLQSSENIREDANLKDGSRVNSVNYLALSVMPKLSWQLNDYFSLFGKAGMAMLSYTEQTKRRNSSYHRNYNDTWSDLVPGYAIGAEVATTVGVKIRLTYTAISGDLEYDDNYWDDIEDVDAKFKTLMLGVHYQF